MYLIHTCALTPNFEKIMDYNQLAMQSAQMAIDTSMSAAQLVLTKKQQERQNAFNLEMWKLQNEYNSPQAQMQRFKDAGLNPNLIYGQGTNGNSTSTPVQVAPDYSKGIDKMQKAFNLIGLQTAYQNMRAAEYDADLKQHEERIAELKKFDAEDMRQAQTDFGALYDYDDRTGRFVFRQPTETDVEVIANNPRGHRLGDRPTNLYWFKQNQMKSERNWLNPYRAGLIENQRQYLMPQIRMGQYESQYYPYSFWIGNGAKVLNALPLPRFNFKFNKNSY